MGFTIGNTQPTSLIKIRVFRVGFLLSFFGGVSNVSTNFFLQLGTYVL